MANVIEDVKNKADAFKDFGLKINKNFDSGLDKWLLKWAASPVSGWIACGMGLVLIGAGALLNNIISKLF